MLLKLMIGEKKSVILLVMVFVAVAFLSFHPTLTGSSISEGYDQDKIIIQNAVAGTTIEQKIFLNVQGEDLIRQNLAVSGQAKEWIGFASSTQTLAPGIDYEIPFFVTIPKETETGDYKATIVLMSVKDFEDSSVLSDEIMRYVDVFITVGDTVQKGSKIVDFVVYPSQVDHLTHISVIVENYGNVETMENLDLKVFDGESLVIEETYEVSMYAFEQKEIKVNFDSKLEIGSYTVEAWMNGQTFKDTLKVENENKVIRNAEMIFNQATVDKEGILTFTSYVENKGDWPIQLNLLGDVNSEETSIKSFKTDTESILPGEQRELSYSFALDKSYSLYEYNLELLSDNVVLDRYQGIIYPRNAVSLGSSFYVLFGLILLLLFVSHFLLSRRGRDELEDE
jgi:hypothetical protein